MRSLIKEFNPSPNKAEMESVQAATRESASDKENTLELELGEFNLQEFDLTDLDLEDPDLLKAFDYE